jgi:hypothetical protein
VKRLAELGFIDTVTESTARIGFVAIISPADAVSRLPDRGFAISDGWLAAYTARMVTTGSARTRLLNLGGIVASFDLQMTLLRGALTNLQRRISRGLPAAVKTERRSVWAAS